MTAAIDLTPFAIPSLAADDDRTLAHACLAESALANMVLLHQRRTRAEEATATLGQGRTFRIDPALLNWRQKRNFHAPAEQGSLAYDKYPPPAHRVPPLAHAHIRQLATADAVDAHEAWLRQNHHQRVTKEGLKIKPHLGRLYDPIERDDTATTTETKKEANGTDDDEDDEEEEDDSSDTELISSAASAAASSSAAIAALSSFGQSCTAEFHRFWQAQTQRTIGACARARKRAASDALADATTATRIAVRQRLAPKEETPPWRNRLPDGRTITLATVPTDDAEIRAEIAQLQQQLFTHLRDALGLDAAALATATLAASPVGEATTNGEPLHASAPSSPSKPARAAADTVTPPGSGARRNAISASPANAALMTSTQVAIDPTGRNNTPSQGRTSARRSTTIVSAACESCIAPIPSISTKCERCGYDPIDEHDDPAARRTTYLQQQAVAAAQAAALAAAAAEKEYTQHASARSRAQAEAEEEAEMQLLANTRSPWV